KTKIPYQRVTTSADVFGAYSIEEYKKSRATIVPKNYFPSKSVTLDQKITHGPLTVSFNRIGFDNAFGRDTDLASRKVALVDVVVKNTSSELVVFYLNELKFTINGKELSYDNVKMIERDRKDMYYDDYIIFPESYHAFQVLFYVSDFKSLENLKVEVPRVIEESDRTSLQEKATYPIKLG
ncbi:MAG: hypothetical protein ACRCWQ_07650, partial [Bacilli bacterium]